MCDRFAPRVLVDQHGCAVIGARGQRVARHRWDFQDVDAFVAAAPRVPTTLFDLVEPRPPRPIPVRVLGVRAGARRKRRTAEHCS